MSEVYQIQPHPRNPDRSAPRNIFGQEYTNRYIQFLEQPDVIIGNDISIASHIAQQRIPYYIQTVPEMLVKRDGRTVEIQNRKLVNENGSKIIRDISRERQACEEYLTSHDSIYQALIKREATLDEAMDSTCRLSVVMAAHDEEKNIYQALEEIASQKTITGEPLTTNSFEIIVINAGSKGYKPESTRQKIDEFREIAKEKYPGLRIIVKDVVFSNIEKGGLGMAYKLGNDIALQRSLNRTNQQAPFYISSKVADMPDIDPYALDLDITKLDKKPYLDAVCAIRDFYPEALMKHDYAFLSVRVGQIASMLMQNHRLRSEVNDDYSYHNSIVTAACNTTYSAEAYARIGGYLSGHQGGDYDIGKRLALLRGHYDQRGVLMPNTHTVERTAARVSESPRRTLYGLATDTNPYNDFANPEINRTIRETSLEEFLSRITEERISENNVTVFEELFTSKWKFIQAFVKNPLQQEALFKRLMTIIGFRKYRVIDGSEGQIIENGNLQKKSENGWQMDYEKDEGGNVKIHNIGNLQNALTTYREKYAKLDTRKDDFYVSPDQIELTEFTTWINDERHLQEWMNQSFERCDKERKKAQIDEVLNNPENTSQLAIFNLTIYFKKIQEKTAAHEKIIAAISHAIGKGYSAFTRCNDFKHAPNHDLFAAFTQLYSDQNQLFQIHQTAQGNYERIQFDLPSDFRF